MNNFKYTRAASTAEAIRTAAADPGARFVAGGTNLVDLMKAYVERPSHLIDVTRLDLKRIEKTAEGGLRLGALATNTSVADHPEIRRDYPVLARAILSGASQQIRNMATVGGNLMQKTRCPYFYDPAFGCNKREPNTGCPGKDGISRSHAIFGWSDKCIAVHPSDMAVALAALDAVVEVEGPKGRRTVAVTDFHRLPGDAPHVETALEQGELITAVVLPPPSFAANSAYLKLRDRASYAFALVSVAAGLKVEGGRIKQARVALGGVAHKPWRSAEAEKALVGKRPDAKTFAAAADAAVAVARPVGENAFKVELARRAVRRALAVAAKGGGVA